ncbi:hypothetical protein HanRHA438_Chr00c19g0851871 [Helianthus annuus]|nr:hypothetical protein HanRHA438_Chr00c19g0851871 [Helianthus annuus]
MAVIAKQIATVILNIMIQAPTSRTSSSLPNHPSGTQPVLPKQETPHWSSPSIQQLPLSPSIDYSLPTVCQLWVLWSFE